MWSRRLCTRHIEWKAYTGGIFPVLTAYQFRSQEFTEANNPIFRRSQLFRVEERSRSSGLGTSSEFVGIPLASSLGDLAFHASY